MLSAIRKCQTTLGSYKYRGCSYYTGIDTSGINSKHRDLNWSNPKIMINVVPNEMLLILNQINYNDVHISG